MFSPASVELSGGFAIAAPVDAAFELFSPLGERSWVPGWDPELLHPPGVTWARGLIFRTREELGEAVWIVTALDRDRHEVEYWRVEAGRYVATVRVRCHAPDSGATEVAVTYRFVGLSDAGNREIAGMSPAAYAEKMLRWKGWIHGSLSARVT
jgi:hypothetical protein